ncbi:PREDICTED: uncharacterized protein LOC107329456 [Acropora digitifera]|uniref:uncharacterized protein LOC107329456 n=1 Tax=Acropora digitifera TaxID=70779 RepID=UPI00077B2548|nr:PREDICTED: uncharacterized protein LOC107329456 [Acropora digitifera]
MLFSDRLIKLKVETVDLNEEQKKDVSDMLILQATTFVKLRNYSKIKVTGVRAFLQYLETTYNLSRLTLNVGSLIISLDCKTSRGLDQLWNDYFSGHLNKAVERHLVTSEMKKKLNLRTIKLKITIEEENYLKCKKVLRLVACSEKNKSYDLEAKELYEEALEIYEKEIPNHPETALNLIFAGRNAKRRKADEKLKKALAMLQYLLGDHFMTALCLKELADFYFFTEKTGEGLEKALNYYKEAMEVMEKLETRNQKESILTLKNYGICHQRKGNFEEAKMLLLEANHVCDNEIEGDYRWKCLVKTDLALFYHEIANRQENEGDDREELLRKMEEFMKEALDMCYRLNDKKSTSGLDNRKQIVKVLDKYPGRFERETYYPDDPL